MKDNVSNKDLYTAILGVQTEVSSKIDILHTRINNVVENRITPLEIWRANIIGQFTVITLAFGIVVNLMFDWIRSKLFKT